MALSFIELYGDNAKAFDPYMTAELREQLDRALFRGIGALDDDETPRGAMVYELLGGSGKEAVRSRIHALQADDEETKAQLLTEYAEAIREEDVIISVYETKDAALAAYFGDHGFTQQKGEGMDITVTAEDIEASEPILKVRRIPARIMPLSEVSEPQYQSFVESCLLKGRQGLVEDLVYIRKSWFEPALSSCAVTDGRVDGALLLKKASSGTLFVSLFAAFDAEYRKNLQFMTAFSARQLLTRCPADTKVVIRRHNVAVKKLTDKLFPGKKGEEVFFGSRAEG